MTHMQFCVVCITLCMQEGTKGRDTVNNNLVQSSICSKEKSKSLSVCVHCLRLVIYYLVRLFLKQCFYVSEGFGQPVGRNQNSLQAN